MIRISRDVRVGDPLASAGAEPLSAPLRIAIGLTVVIGSAKLAREGTRWALGSSEAPTIPPELAATSVAIAAALVGYWAFVRVVERRKPGELSGAGAVRHLGAGFATSAAAIAFTFAVLWAAGIYSPQEPNPAAAALPVLVAALATATLEELIFRGLVFRIFEESLGTTIAFACCIGVFGLAHIFNPGSTLLNCAAMSLAAGVPFTAAYLLTRRLWLPIGMHAGWNFIQLGVFGEGNLPSREAWLAGVLTGPEWLTGGSFGLEGSVLLVAVGLALGSALLVAALRRGRRIAPVWTRELPAE